jgi:hypothetical protein
MPNEEPEVKQMSLARLEKIIKMMTKYSIDLIEIDGVKISKKLHLAPQKKMPTKPNMIPPPVNHQDSPFDDILFHSSSAPRLDMESLVRYGAPPAVINGTK